MLESLLEGYAEYYSAELAVKVKRDLTENALKGKWNGGTVPFGYTVNKEQKLEIEPVSADVVRQKKHKCDKKMLPKDKLENFIVHKTMEILQDDSVIEELAALLYRIQHSESSLLPRLEQQLHEKEREIENIVSAIQ